MIKLDAVPPPVELTPDVVKELTEKFKQNNNASVWRQDYIKKALLEMSNSKCCYCECTINSEGCFVHIEHFHPKNVYQNEVVSWDNLLPACARCNTKKNTLDTKAHPIIHPVKNDPKQHLQVRQFYFYHRDGDDLGEFTIEKLDLNDADNLAVPRFKLAHALIGQLNDLEKEIANHVKSQTNLTPIMEATFSRKLRNVMQHGTADKKYSAVMSSVILTNSSYEEIKRLFTTNDLWNDEFIELEKQVNYCALI